MAISVWYALVWFVHFSIYLSFLGEEDNSAEHLARDSLMTFSIYIVHLIPYITTYHNVI